MPTVLSFVVGNERRQEDETTPFESVTQPVLCETQDTVSVMATSDSSFDL